MLNSKLQAEDKLSFQFATDGEGNYGYLGADDSFIPFRGSMTIKAYKYKDLQYYAPTGIVSLSYTVKKDCSAVLICSTNQPSGYPFSSNGVSCKINGVEQNGNIIGQSVNWFSDRIVFVENLLAGSVIDLSVSGTCSAEAYGHLAVAVITNE